ncbi:MAG: NADH-quinone oxidoreductase subunit N [Dehalococcoidia bacterium]|nr:NADH-quinone oxidoreductase subunit N [Dehalococcoidia bacterium]
MILDQIKYIAPELSLLCFALLVILVDLFIANKRTLAVLAVAGALVSAFFVLMLWNGQTAEAFYLTIAIDQFGLFFKLLILTATTLVILASSGYVSKFERFQGEFYALLMLSAVGLMLLVSAINLITIFVALELSSISLYVLVSFLKDKKSSEAGLKYLILGSVASAVLLYGMALVFGLTGTTCLTCIADYIKGMPAASLLGEPALLVGLVLVIAGFGFKIASVPFQMWVPDVYEGAPTPVTAYLSVASKAAGFAVIARILLTAFGVPDWLHNDWAMIIAVLAAVTMTVGNVTALLQTNIKRMLGYSSIAQAGYLMVGLAAMGMASQVDGNVRSGLVFFLLSYTLTNLGAFIAIIAISNKINSDEIDDYTGMGKRAPLLAVALTICMVSLTGLPPTAGLIAKIYIFSGAVDQGLLWLVIIAVINSCISAFYYFKVIKVMWMGEPASADKVTSSWPEWLAIALCCIPVIIIGVLPGAFIALTQSASVLFGI